MRYGRRTLIGWIVAATVVYVLAFNRIGRPELWVSSLHLYFSTIACPGFWTYHAMKRVPEGADYQTQWFAWAPVIIGAMAFAATLELLHRAGQIG